MDKISCNVFTLIPATNLAFFFNSRFLKIFTKKKTAWASLLNVNCAAIIETFRFDYEYDFLSFELVMLTSRSLAILQENGRTATRSDPTKTLRTLVTNLVELLVEVILVVKV